MKHCRICTLDNIRATYKSMRLVWCRYIPGMQGSRCLCDLESSGTIGTLWAPADSTGTIKRVCWHERAMVDTPIKDKVGIMKRLWKRFDEIIYKLILVIRSWWLCSNFICNQIVQQCREWWEICDTTSHMWCPHDTCSVNSWPVTWIFSFVITNQNWWSYPSHW